MEFSYKFSVKFSINSKIRKKKYRELNNFQNHKYKKFCLKCSNK